jgi:hypothetical protein
VLATFFPHEHTLIDHEDIDINKIRKGTGTYVSNPPLLKSVCTSSIFAVYGMFPTYSLRPSEIACGTRLPPYDDPRGVP